MIRCKVISGGQESDLSSQSPVNVHLLELVKSSQHTSSGNTSQDVGSSSLHQGHESLVPENLLEAVEGTLVLGSASRCHHHTPSDSVNGVGHESSSDGDTPTQEEGQGDSSISSQDQRLQSVVETKVHSSVDEDTNSGDDKSSVETLDTIRLEGLDVDINQTIELSLASLALSIISKPRWRRSNQCNS